jgi:hypothetical protein
MALVLSKDYGTLHNTLIGAARTAGVYPTSKDRGLCFKISHEWLMSRWRGLEFDGDKLDIITVGKKQMEYLKQADATDMSQYQTWFSNANALSQVTLQSWGRDFGQSCAPPYVAGTLVGADPLKGNPDTAMIVGFFGVKNAGGVWGHATAYCCRNAKGRFFDVNYGVFKFTGSDDAPTQMDDWIKSKYETDKTITDFALYQVV